MRTAHFALTPLAGSPIRIVNALNRHTSIRARLVTHDTRAYGPRTFEEDIDWRTGKEQALDALEQADVIVLHHFIDLSDNPFGIDFGRQIGRGKKVVRQFHAAPATIARTFGCDVARILSDPLPQLVVAQYHERHYPRARPVPLLVPIDDEAYTPLEGRPDGNGPRDPVRIFYGPTFAASAWSSRWDTKGAPETRRLLKRLERGPGRIVAVVSRDLPHARSLAERRRSDIVIDEMVTGSFHTSSLESLAQGVPTFAYLDRRTMRTLMELTGTLDLPWMNFRLEEAEGPLRALAADADLRRELGRNSRRWMERYWREDTLVGHYERAIADVLERPGTFSVPRFDESNRVAVWFAREMHDLIHQARRGRELSRRGAAWIRIRHAVSTLRHAARRALVRLWRRRYTR
jgi:hypothetical protein